MPKQQQIFGDAGLTLAEAQEMTLASMQAWGARHPHWAVSWSGGKDSTATLTYLLHLLDSGQLAPPERLTVLYADTRQELPPLYASAMQMIGRMLEDGRDVRIARAPVDKRFMVYIFGRGVPPPNNNTLRWCTRQIKLDPMAAELGRLTAENSDTILTITGVRQGESAIRDRRIEMACGKDGAECGQGWYQEVLPNATGIRGRIATLAPLLHWRVCHVWDWLQWHAPGLGWPTGMLADAYGGEEAEEINARTGCIACPLASQERALDAILDMDDWEYLKPLSRLKPLYRELREPRWRLRKSGAERLKDGSLAANPQRMGPLTLDARLMGLERVLGVQAECNAAARRLGRPEIDILNAEEEGRIRELIEANTWPKRWTGEEPVANVPLDKILPSGVVQPLLVGDTMGRA